MNFLKGSLFRRNTEPEELKPMEESVPLSEVASKLKLVTEDHDLVVQGRRMGICFG